MRDQIVELLTEDHAMTEAEIASCMGLEGFRERRQLKIQLDRMVQRCEIEWFDRYGKIWYCTGQKDGGTAA